MTWVAVAVGGAAVVGGAVSYMGAQSSANAAGNAARAQAAQAEANRAAIMGESGQLSNQVNNLANATPQELNILGQSYNAASENLSKQQQLMASIDPALMEASKQALTLLQGGHAAINDPMMQMRQQQRGQLLNQLRATYGPGAETTSAGQRALSQFDNETQMQFQQNQQNSLGQVMGIANSGGNGSNVMNAIGGLESVGQGYSAIQQRQINGALNVGGMTMGAISGSGQQLLQTAGAPFVAQGLQGQAMSSMGNQIANTGGMLGSAYMMGNRSSAGGGGGTGGGGTGGNNMGVGNPTGNSGQVNGMGLSNPGTTNEGFWNSNPYSKAY